MMIYVLVLYLGLAATHVSSTPQRLSPADAIPYLEEGGLLSYNLSVQQCEINLPKLIPIYSWGERVSDVILYDNGAHDFTIEFSITRRVNGSRYNLTDGAVRFTQVTFMPKQVFVEITDVNEDAPCFLQTGSITCDYTKKGVTLYGRSFPVEELKTYDVLVSHLEMGYDINYVLNWDKCSPRITPTNRWWSGRISGYRFKQTWGVEFTQLVDSAQREFYMLAGVDSTGGLVQVKLYSVDRLKKQQSDVETRNCVLGVGYRVFIAKST